jgi:hypothetical protein
MILVNDPAVQDGPSACVVDPPVETDGSDVFADHAFSPAGAEKGPVARCPGGPYGTDRILCWRVSRHGQGPVYIKKQ